MNLHQLIDVLEGYVRRRKEQAPIESHLDDLHEFVRENPQNIHPDVEPAKLKFDSPPQRSTGRTWFKKNETVYEQKLQFNSSVVTPNTENNLVHGVKWYADGNEKSTAAMVMVHGSFAPSFAAEKLLAKPLLKNDIHVFALAAPYHMDRMPGNSAFSGQYLLSGDIPRLIGGLVQCVADYRALIKYLKSTGYTKIFIEGISMGGTIALLVMVLEKINGGYLLMPAVDFYNVFNQAPMAKAIRQSALKAGWQQETLKKAFQCIKPGELGFPKTETSKIELHYGKYDMQVRPLTIEKFIRQWRGIQSYDYQRGHRTMGLELLKIRNQLANWCIGK